MNTHNSPQGAPIDAPAGPARQRIGHIDSLRGLAVFGILLINIGYLAWPRAHNWPIYPVVFETSLDHVVDFCLRWFAKGKFYVIFSFLLGVGMAMQQERMEKQVAKFSGFFTRRMVALLVIGLIHGIFIWYGDILVTYALVSLLFLGFQFLPTRGLWIAAFIIILGQTAYDYGPRYMEISKTMQESGMTTFVENYNSGLDWVKGNYEETLKVYLGSYGDALPYNIGQVKDAVLSLPGWATHLIFSYLLGIWAWRRRIISDPASHLGFLKKVAYIGIPVGLVMNFYSFYLYDQDVLAFKQLIAGLCWFLGKYVLGYGYVAVFLLLVAANRFEGVMKALQPVGQMALTNYIMHSVIFTLIFNGYGLGLLGQVGQTYTFLMVLTVCIMQIYTSRLWLNHFRFGPIEWLWRSMTYLKIQPLKK